MKKKRPGRKPNVRARIVELLKQQPLLSFTDLGTVVGTTKQYVQLVADTELGLREERQKAKDALIAKLKKKPLGYIPVPDED